MVKIRLTRIGSKKKPFYRLVATDARSPRDGRFLEILGSYNPHANPIEVHLKSERIISWIRRGAQPTDTVKAMLSYRGILFQKHLQIGVIKGALTQEAADKKLEEHVEILLRFC